MVELVTLTCTACRKRNYCIKERTQDNEWFFKRIEPLGIPIFFWHKDSACVHCGTGIILGSGEERERLWESLKTRLHVEKDEPFHFPTGDDRAV